MDLNTITEIARPPARDAIPAWTAGDAWLAGGTWLFSEPQPRLRRLIDLTALGWAPLEITDEGLTIAATCRIAQLAAVGLPARWTAAPLFEQCCRALFASFKVWNTATLGGNICMSLPAGPMISLTAALDGICTIWTADGTERRVAVADFVTGPQTNVLKPGELLRRVELPARALASRTAFRQISLNPHGRSAALLIGTLAPDGAFALTVTAATRRPVKIGFAAAPDAMRMRQRIEDEIPPSLFFDDVHGAPAWRRHMTLRLAEEIRRELTDGRPA